MGCCCSDNSDVEENGKLKKWKPLDKRGCTDIIPLFVFTCFIVGMGVITGYSILDGAVDRLIYGFDSYGNICNKKNEKLFNHSKSGMDLTGKKYIFFMDITDAEKSLEVCVEKCPDVKLNTKDELIAYYDRTHINYCDYDITRDQMKSAEYQKYGPCPQLPVSESESILFRCIPDYLPAFLIYMAKQLNNIPVLNTILADLYLTRYTIILLCTIAFVNSILMVLLIRFWTSIVVVLINVFLCITSIGGTGLMWYLYASSDNQLTLNNLNITLKIEEENKESFLTYSIIATIATVIIVLLVIVMRKRVGLVVELFNQAGKLLQNIPLLFFQPVVTFAFLIVFWVCWLLVFGCLATSGNLEVVDEERGFVKFVKTQTITYMWWYHLVALFWLTEFALACQQMVIAGAVAQWYFTRDKKKIGAPICTSTNMLVCYHLGSCAFGSLFIVLVALPRWILTYIYRNCKDSENMIAKCIMKCCICCLWCLEKILRYLNYNAYSMVAINGRNFCRSACDVVSTFLSNPLRVAAINSVGSFVLFLGKLLVAVSMAAVCGILVVRSYNDQVRILMAPIACVFIFSYVVAHCFFSVYGMTIDTLFLCFCEDSRVNDGSPGKEYFMSKSLMAFVRNSSKHLSNLDGNKKSPLNGSREENEMLNRN